MTHRKEPWFAPKRHGYGAGMPIAWQGWAMLAIYLSVVGTATLLVERAPAAFWSILFVATAVMVPICAAKTRGGWRWRRGGSD